ncbi:hypothetical protein PENARI_c003G03345 [Penicillium arizonense]|uniref:Cucumopine synthase C-terminal helical bundle domain-containing protein n=1 Tax=Penicillium arizonense TaxID=1835702 RepID=A0A1F5LSJ7_PENAI|nr:hypothetical protein PENARI_c003G03345 [Penicillium arizonense]OGE56182.1 hypothetical protein PENARI_c003G03345 [Penicillium arizonense]
MDQHNESQALRELRIKWPKFDVTVTTHALVTGDHLYHLVPAEPLLYTAPEHKIPDRTQEPDGTVFLSKFQHLAIKYGRVTEHHPAAPCGNVIPEDLEKLRWLGNKVWKCQLETKEPTEVILWDASTPEPGPQSLSLRLQRTGVTKEVKDLVREIHEETDKTWSGVSDNVQAIHSGRASSKPGAKDSYFAAMVFANSEVRTLGYYIFDNILEIAASYPEFDLKHLVVLYKKLVSTPAEFLGYVGTEYLRDSHRKINDLITLNVETNTNQSDAREDLLAMNFKIISGEDVLKVYDDKPPGSKNTIHRHFCSNCSSPIYTTATGTPEYESMLTVTAGTMDLGNDSWKPSMELFCDILQVANSLVAYYTNAETDLCASWPIPNWRVAPPMPAMDSGNVELIMDKDGFSIVYSLWPAPQTLP